MKSFLAVAALGVAAFALTHAGGGVKPSKVGIKPGGVEMDARAALKPKPGDELAEFSGGCFWGTEEEFRKVPGVVATAVGYTGGHTLKPTYEQVCTHTTGHAETVLVEFYPKKVSYAKLVGYFWAIHDPAQADGQGPNLGDNYRSAIWTFGPEQQRIASASLAAQEKKEKSKFVTTVKPAPVFWLAERYHQQYDEKTGTNSCPPPRLPTNLVKG